MVSTQTATILMGVGGLLVFFGPNAWGAVSRMFSSKSRGPSPGPSSATDAEVVEHFRRLLELRSFLGDQSEAVKAIDTVLTPALLKAREEGGGPSDKA